MNRWWNLLAIMGALLREMPEPDSPAQARQDWHNRQAQACELIAATCRGIAAEAEAKALQARQHADAYAKKTGMVYGHPRPTSAWTHRDQQIVS